MLPRFPGDWPEAVAHILDASPNPFHQTTRIRLGLARPGDARLHVYHARGRLVRELMASGAPAGESFVAWDRRDSKAARIPSGVYFIRLADASESAAVRVTVLQWSLASIVQGVRRS